jgi:hypothetical protein
MKATEEAATQLAVAQRASATPTIEKWLWELLQFAPQGLATQWLLAEAQRPGPYNTANLLGSMRAVMQADQTQSGSAAPHRLAAYRKAGALFDRLEMCLKCGAAAPDNRQRSILGEADASLPPWAHQPVAAEWRCPRCRTHCSTMRSLRDDALVVTYELSGPAEDALLLQARVANFGADSASGQLRADLLNGLRRICASRAVAILPDVVTACNLMSTQQMAALYDLVGNMMASLEGIGPNEVLGAARDVIRGHSHSFPHAWTSDQCVRLFCPLCMRALPLLLQRHAPHLPTWWGTSSEMDCPAYAMVRVLRPDTANTYTMSVTVVACGEDVLSTVSPPGRAASA